MTIPKPLKQEIATVKKDIFYPAFGGLFRSQDAILQQQGHEQGLLIYDELERDPQVFAVLQKRKMTVCSREWQVFTASEKKKDEKLKKWLENQLINIDFDRITFDLLDCLLKGYSVIEVLWKEDKEGIIVDKLRTKDQRRFTFDEDYNLRLLTPQNQYLGELLPPKKFIYASWGAKDGNPFGLGLGNKLFWPVYFKRQGIEFWLTFCDKFGSPTAVGTYPPNATEYEQNTLLNALAAISQDAGIIKPEGMSIELLEAARSGTVDTYEKLCRFMDEQISKSVLGETLSTDVGDTGSYAASKTHDNVRMQLAKADADFICRILNNTLIRWLIELNFPSQEIPQVWRTFEEQEDLSTRITIDKTIYDMGYRPTMDYIEDKYGGEWIDTQEPQTDEGFLQASGITDQPTDQPSDTAAQPTDTEASLDQEQPTDTNTEFSEDQPDYIDDWAQKALDNSQSFFKNMNQTTKTNLEELIEIFKEIDLESFSENLAQGMLAAELAGRYEVLEESDLLESDKIEETLSS